MNFTDLFLMRHELMLVLLAAIILVSELLFDEKGSSPKIRFLASSLFFINLIVGFLPAETGEMFGGMYRTSDMHILIKNILNIGVFIIFLQSDRWLANEENSFKTAEFFIIMISTLTGMFFMISAGDFLMFYIGLELATIPLAALAAYEVYKNKSAEAGIKLILSSALSSGVLLWGISMIYGTTGSVYFEEVKASFTISGLSILGFIFFMSGMGFKISLVPFHLWTADVYEGSPIGVTSYLSVISKGAALTILTIILFTVFPAIIEMWQNVIYIIAIITMTVGNLFAIRQNNIKRFLAFSSISQAGYILLGIIGGNQFGMASLLYYIMVYIFSNLAAFGVVAAISNASGRENISDYNGLYKTNPKLSLTLMLAMFSLAGIPPVAGFFGKFFLFTAAAEKGFYILVLIAVINTIISLYYYLLVVKAMFINKSDEPISHFKSDWVTKLGLALCIAGVVAMGFVGYILEYFNNVSFGV